MNTQTLVAFLTTTALIALLGALAINGSVAALIAVTVLATVTVFSSGVLLALSIVKTMQSKAQQDFYDNTQENLGIMGQLQNVQNKQSKMLLDEMNTINKLPKRANTQATFEIMEGVFDELENQ